MPQITPFTGISPTEPVPNGEEGWIGYRWTSIVYGVLGASVILYSAIGCHEHQEYLETEKPQLWDSIKMLLRNIKFWIAGFANAFYNAAMSLVLAAIPFYAKYALQIPDNQSTILFATVLFIAMGAVAVWAKLIKKYCVVPIWRIALMLLGVGFIPLYFANSLVSAILASSLLGFGFAGDIATMDLIGPESLMRTPASRVSGVKQYSSALQAL